MDQIDDFLIKVIFQNKTIFKKDFVNLKEILIFSKLLNYAYLLIKLFFFKTRKGYATEGAVLYFIDSEYNIIGMLKKKTTWYIVLRAVREKIKSYLSPKATMSLEDLIS